jgi:hypothetical protein
MTRNLRSEMRAGRPRRSDSFTKVLDLVSDRSTRREAPHNTTGFVGRRTCTAAASARGGFQRCASGRQLFLATPLSLRAEEFDRCPVCRRPAPPSVRLSRGIRHTFPSITSRRSFPPVINLFQRFNSSPRIPQQFLITMQVNSRRKRVGALGQDSLNGGERSQPPQ